jgi:hypothetical protein
MIYCTRPDCAEPALRRGVAKDMLCSKHRRQDIVAQQSQGPPLETMEQSEWNKARGYDPITRTYKEDHNEPPARRPKGERWS